MLRRHLRSLTILTLGMGAAVTISWFAFARPLPPLGLDPASVLHPTRLTIYGVQLILVGILTFWHARTGLRAATDLTLAWLVIAAWLGQGLVLTLIGEQVVANALSPAVAWYYWIVATAGPLQPLAAFIGGWLALRRARAAASELPA